MSQSWPEFAYDLYHRACTELNYPQVPFGPFLNELIQPEDVVADLGCGIGMPARYLADRCKKVIAIDENKTALGYLERWAQENGIDNIQTIHGSWPEIQLEACDALISFYAPGMTSDRKGIEALLKTAKRGILTAPGPKQDGGFFLEIAQKLGVPPRKQGCGNGCLARGKLEMAGCQVSCKNILHEFGQPVKDTEEAARFLCWQLHLDASYLEKVKQIVPEFLGSRDGRPFLPNLRSTCVLTYRHGTAIEQNSLAFT